MATYHKDLETIIEAARKTDVTFESGLSDEEIHKIQSSFGVEFPPELVEFYKIAVPVTKITSSGKPQPFTPWRKALETGQNPVQIFMDWVCEGICFDVVNNNFWMPGWGTRPSGDDEAQNVARKSINASPKLIPIYGHRAIPSSTEEGNPVFSVWQTDIIYYGYDLVDYLIQELMLDVDCKRAEEAKTVQFWTQVVKMNTSGRLNVFRNEYEPLIN